MDVYSWFRRSLPRPQKTNGPSAANGEVNGKEEAQRDKEEEEEEEIFGVTDQLVEFIKKTFTLETFRNFPLQDEEAANCGEGNGNVRKDLSEWQERHATLVLSKVKEMSQLRFRLCPRCMKERQFWRIYFTLVKSYTAEYELRAIQLARLRQMTTESKNVLDENAFEVEMSETKQPTSVGPSEQNLDSLTHNS